MDWPTSPEELAEYQDSLAAATPNPWSPGSFAVAIGGVFVCFGRGGTGLGEKGDIGWAGAALLRAGRVADQAVATGGAGGPYRRGCLAIREGFLLEMAVRALAQAPEVLLVNATGRDHPRRAGLAIHLGAALGIPTVGVTHRPLIANGEWPQSETPGSIAPLAIGADTVGFWLRTRKDCRPLAVHAGWRTTPELAAEVVLSAVTGSRTPEPIRQSRRLARTARHRGIRPV